MWSKDIIGEISKYVPEDGKYHNIQIVNDCLFIDGQFVRREREWWDITIHDFHGYDRVLTADEIRHICERGEGNNE